MGLFQFQVLFFCRASLLHLLDFRCLMLDCHGMIQNMYISVKGETCSRPVEGSLQPALAVLASFGPPSVRASHLVSLRSESQSSFSLLSCRYPHDRSLCTAPASRDLRYRNSKSAISILGNDSCHWPLPWPVIYLSPSLFMTSLPERIAHLVQSKFETLPLKCKPRTLAEGRREWTPLSAVVLAKDGDEDDLTCISLATGTKCLSASALPKCHGMVLHDSHAEILALRGFNYWLLTEVQNILHRPAYQSPFLELAGGPESDHNPDTPLSTFCPPLRLKQDVSIHFFTTEAPCGDASMEILMSCMPLEETEPWPVDDNALTALQGRGHFSLLGYVRRKPARADAEPSHSKSCTDKLAVKQFTSALSYPADLFIQQTTNAYIQNLIVYAHQHDATSYQRAFGPSGRLSNVVDLGRFFNVLPLPRSFPRFSYESTPDPLSDNMKPKASNISALWIKGSPSDAADVVEVLINGVKQGFKQWDSRSAKASSISRYKLLQLALRITITHSAERPEANHAVNSPRLMDDSWLLALHHALSANTYGTAKATHLRRSRRVNKDNITAALGNWTKNEGDHDWKCG